MRIVQVTPMLISLPSDTWSWVRVETDRGITGWGEYSGNPITNAAVTAVLKVLGQRMAEKDPLDVADCLSEVRSWRYPSFLDFRSVMMAASALDMALWDIRAKAAGVPLRKLFSSSGAASIALYANLNRLLRKDRSLPRLVAAAQAAVESGLGMVKLAPFDEVTPLDPDPDISAGVHRCREVGKHIGLERISLDCHCRFTPQTFGRMLDCFGAESHLLQFIEDPIRIRSERDIAPIKELWPTYRYASGEDLFSTAELAELAGSGQLDILNPDIKYIGGVTGGMQVIPLLGALGVKVMLHNPSGPIATACSAQLSVLCGPDSALEFAFGDNDTRCRALDGGEPVEGGNYILTDRPGIGVEPSEAFLRQYANTAV